MASGKARKRKTGEQPAILNGLRSQVFKELVAKFESPIPGPASYI